MRAIGIIIIVVIIIIIITIIYFIIQTKSVPIKDEPALLVQICAEKHRPEDVTNSIFSMFDKKPEIINMNQISEDRIKIDGGEYYLGIYNPKNEKRSRYTDKIHNNTRGLIGGFNETAHRDNLSLINRNDYELFSTNNYKGSQNLCIIKTVYYNKYNSKKYTLFNVTQRHIEYFNIHGYRALYSIFRFIETDYSVHNIPFIIMGNFNVHNWDFIRKMVFKEKVWSSGKFKLCTAHDNRGLAAPDGIIVHKALACRVGYGVKHISPIKCNERYILYANLHQMGSGEYIDGETVQMVNNLKAIDSTLNHINKPVTNNNEIDEKQLMENCENIVVDESIGGSGQYISIERMFNKILKKFETKV